MSVEPYVNGKYGVANLQDIDGLFRAVPVPQIRALERRARADIERKQTQLRAVVSERYRDLLEAAETIVALKAQSKEIMTSFKEMRQSAHTGLASYSKKQQHSSAGKAASPVTYEVAACCRMLESTVDLLWDYVEAEELVEAAKQLVMQRRIIYSISQCSREGIPDKVKQGIDNRIRSAQENYSLAKQEILRQIDLRLEDNKTSAESAADCLVTLVILESTTARGCLQRLLQARLSQIKALHVDASGIGEEGLPQSAQAIVATLLDVVQLFLASSEGLLGSVASLQQRLQNLEKAPLISLLSYGTFAKSRPIWLKHLPQGLAQFALYLDTNGGLGSISPEVVQQDTLDWYQNVVQIQHAEIQRMVERTTSWTAATSSLKTLAAESAGRFGQISRVLPEATDAGSLFTLLGGDPLLQKTLDLFEKDCPDYARWSELLEPTFLADDGNSIIDAYFIPMDPSAYSDGLPAVARHRRAGRFARPWMTRFGLEIDRVLADMCERRENLCQQARLVGREDLVSNGIAVVISKTLDHLLEVLSALRESTAQTRQGNGRMCQIAQALETSRDLHRLLQSCSEAATKAIDARLRHLARESRSALFESCLSAGRLEDTFENSHYLLEQIPDAQWIAAMNDEQGSALPTRSLSQESSLLHVPYHLLSTDKSTLTSQLTSSTKTTGTLPASTVDAAAMNEEAVEPACRYFRLLS